MNRSVATLLASLLTLAVTACGPTTPPVPLTNVTIWWEFDRNTLINGVWGIVPYDTIVNWPPGTGSRGCPQSGVDFVIVFDNSGNQLSAPTPCINQNVQGAVVTGFQAPSVYWIEGYRNGVSVPLYRGQVTIDGLAPPPAPPFSGTAIAAGIPSDLIIDMVLVDPFSGPAGYRTCGAANVDGFDGWLEDGAATLVWRNYIPCQTFEMPSIQFGPVDRDDLFVWIDTYRPPPGLPAIPWSICDFPFPHFQASLFGLTMDAGACPNPHPAPLRAAQ